jgi:chaperonin GroES
MYPINDNIIVTVDEIETTTASGLVIPESVNTAPHTATIVAVAKDQTKLEAGQKLVIRQHAGAPFTLFEVEYHLIHINDVIAVLDV